MFIKFKAAALRRAFARSDAKRDAGLSIPEDVELLEALPYGAHKMNTLDLSRPKGVENPPLIVNVHGGGYVYGSTLPYRYYCASLAQRGFAVVSFNYRLAPQHKFPAPLEDLNEVFKWCLANAEKYGFDAGNVFMLGDSAGAQLASQYAAMWANPDYAALMEIIPPADLNIRAVGLNCGMYALGEVVEGIGKADDIMECYFTRNFARFGKKLDVLGHIDSRYPPAYLISAPGDFLLDCCVPMWEFLRSRGVEAEYKIYGGGDTGHVFHVNMRDPHSAAANDGQLAFFRKYIK